MITETFESSNQTIPFTGDWVRTTTSPQAGSYCYRSGVITHNQTSKTSFKVTAPSGGTLEFWYRTDSEKNYDKLTVKADSTTIVNGESGTGGTWTKVTHTLPIGTTEIEFSYVKDGSNSNGTDAVYIDQVTVSGMNISVSAGSGGGSGTPGESINNPIILTGTSASGSFQAGGAVFYKFTAPSTGSFTFTTDSTTDLKMDLLNIDGTKVLDTDDDSGGNRQPKITYNLISGTVYYVKVYAYSNSVAASFTLLVTPPAAGNLPGMVYVSTQSKTSSSATLNLTSTGATSFNVYRSTTSSGSYSLVASGVQTPYTNSGLSSSTAYYYKAEGVNSYGVGPLSAYNLVITESAGSPPGAASISVASTTTSSATLNLSATGATSFNLYRSTSATGTYSLIASSVSTPYTNTGLSSGTTYYYKTEGKNIYGTGNMSTYVAATTDLEGSPPDTPTLTVGSATSNSLTLTYSGTGATSYDIYRDNALIASERTSTTYTDTGLNSSTLYKYHVVAKNAYGTTQSPSKYGGTTKPSGNPPDTPTLTVDSATSNSLTLTYSATGATSYDIYRDNTLIVSERTSTTYTDTGLNSSTLYKYHVVAKNAYGTVQSPSKYGGTKKPSGNPPNTLMKILYRGGTDA
ncbi:pre-peptidase C-terminal domain-containing protein [Brevibacillus panacihumi]|uniref:pre-peptidase C-terminal domain-containing protein n=1 Tax=Brevibacillus panacihumi TaxID=497735 RepID=UPI0020966E9E|nr:pre-peptidase C-terminal domain-containing protein [Brevibacillus panacihumi]